MRIQFERSYPLHRYWYSSNIFVSDYRLKYSVFRSLNIRRIWVTCGVIDSGWTWASVKVKRIHSIDSIPFQSKNLICTFFNDDSACLVFTRICQFCHYMKSLFWLFSESAGADLGGRFWGPNFCHNCNYAVGKISLGPVHPYTNPGSAPGLIRYLILCPPPPTPASPPVPPVTPTPTHRPLTHKHVNLTHRKQLMTTKMRATMSRMFHLTTNQLPTKKKQFTDLGTRSHI